MIKINRPLCPNRNSLNRGNYKHKDNKLALENASYHKCMYCESKISHICYGDVEHIKPKSIFPEFEFEWENLGFVCSRCNGSKLNQYNSANPYINPYEEDPEDHILAIGSILGSKHGSERGEITINHINLNRNSLIERRNDKLNTIRKTIDACYRTNDLNLRENALNELKKESNPDKEYSLCIKCLFKIQKI